VIGPPSDHRQAEGERVKVIVGRQVFLLVPLQSLEKRERSIDRAFVRPGRGGVPSLGAGRERDTEPASVSDGSSAVSTRFAEGCEVELPAPLDQALNPQSVPLLPRNAGRSEEHTSELQSRVDLVCRLLLE